MQCHWASVPLLQNRQPRKLAVVGFVYPYSDPNQLDGRISIDHIQEDIDLILNQHVVQPDKP